MTSRLKSMCRRTECRAFGSCYYSLKESAEDCPCKGIEKRAEK